MKNVAELFLSEEILYTRQFLRKKSLEESRFRAEEPKLYEIKMRNRFNAALAQVNKILKDLLHEDVFLAKTLCGKLHKVRLKNPGKDISIPMLKGNGIASKLSLMVPFKKGNDFSPNNLHSQVMLVTKDYHPSVILDDVEYFENAIILIESIFDTLGEPETEIQIS